MAKAIPEFASEIKKYGARDFEACFSCGTCTATCDLTEKNANFPRMLIRYGMLGMKDEILKSKELWLCYSCGECTISCPRQAAPAEYMSAMRRFAIAGYEPSGLTKLLFKGNVFSIAITIMLAVILGFFLLTLKPEITVSRWIFNIVPYEVIHNTGILIFSLTGLSMAWGFIALWRHLSARQGKDIKKKASLKETFTKLAGELGTMKRYRNCNSEEESYWQQKPGVVKPRFVHWSIMWGFIGLLAATVLDFVLKDPAATIWWPSRILGTLAGLLLLYGTSIAMIYRLKKITRAYRDTKLADLMFLSFLWIAGLTGFWLEISVSMGADNLISHIVLILHTIVSMELVLLFAFSKFAHALYRPVALFFHFRG